MNWVTTNIRFPEDLYMELKMEAAKTRKSIAALVRERVVKRKAKLKKIDVEKEMKELEKLARSNARYMKGISLSEKLIEMRYEQ